MASTIKVDTIDTPDGTGNITVSRPLSGSGASLTSLPAANLTGTLPAIDGSNLTGISGGFEVGCRVELSSDQGSVATGTWTKVTLDNELHDLGSNFASNKFTVPTTGEYLVIGHVGYTTVVDEKRYQSAIYKNGSSVCFASHSSGGTNKIFVTVAAVIQANATDYFELYGYHNNGSNNVIEGHGSGSALSVHRLA
jgi:hypothetical protein